MVDCAIRCGKTRTICVLWTILVVYMGILGVCDLVVAVKSWSSCTINKNVGRWPIGLVVFMVIIDSFSTSTQFKKETYDKVDLIVLAIGYFGALIWNIVGTVWFVNIYGMAQFKYSGYPNYCNPIAYWYVYVRLIISWLSLLVGSVGVVYFLAKTRCRPLRMMAFLTEYFQVNGSSSSCLLTQP